MSERSRPASEHAGSSREQRGVVPEQPRIRIVPFGRLELLLSTRTWRGDPQERKPMQVKRLPETTLQTRLLSLPVGRLR